ncbi:MAG TPA: thioredoxin domain-containing protein [Bryobacteraceae bacterium]|nr:thioredoxin domain-containing protein [Bryobacteraceae bacterium]
MKIFQRLKLYALSILCASVWMSLLQSAAAQAPKIDKPAISKYLRYAEGFSPQVNMTVGDPQPSVFPGLYEIEVTLKAGRNEVVKTYYLTSDGKRLISGSVYDLHQSPFAGNIPLLKEEGAPAFGPANAPVKIFLFSDFECPYCKEEAKTLRENVAKDHPNDVRIIYKDFPLDSIHPWARPAAIAGQCIAGQKPAAFWSFHDWIYEHQGEINPGNVKDKIGEFAKTQNIDTQKLSACEANPATAARVDKTVDEGRKLGVTQTPTMFVNGRSVPGVLNPGQMNLLIQLELGRAKESSTATTDKCCEVNIPSLARK